MDNGTAPLARFARTVRSDGWTNLFPALEELCQACIGHKLFSVSEFRLTGPESGVAARIYTSDSRNYPLSGLKEIVPNRWTGRVIREREVFVANSVEGFSDVFPDHEMIAALGLGSVINLPWCWAESSSERSTCFTPRDITSTTASPSSTNWRCLPC